MISCKRGLNESFFGDDISLEAENDFFYLFNQVLAHFVLPEGNSHVFPNPLKMFLANWHVFMRLFHVSTLVLIRSTEEHGQEIGHQMMKL